MFYPKVGEFLSEDTLMADERTHLDGSGNIVTDEVLFPLTDQQGTVRDTAKVDANGATAVVDHIVYDSFGKVVSETDPSQGTLIGYAGLPYDKASGTNRSATRPYDPSTGQWTQPDLIDLLGRDPNRYRYCGSSPTNATDPSGLADASKDKLEIVTTMYDSWDEFSKKLKGAAPGALVDFTGHCRQGKEVCFGYHDWSFLGEPEWFDAGKLVKPLPKKCVFFIGGCNSGITGGIAETIGNMKNVQVAAVIGTTAKTNEAAAGRLYSLFKAALLKDPIHETIQQAAMEANAQLPKQAENYDEDGTLVQLTWFGETNKTLAQLRGWFD
jgi:RHS repeat-associated protein